MADIAVGYLDRSTLQLAYLRSEGSCCLVPVELSYSLCTVDQSAELNKLIALDPEPLLKKSVRIIELKKLIDLTLMSGLGFSLSPV